MVNVVEIVVGVLLLLFGVLLWKITAKTLRSRFSFLDPKLLNRWAIQANKFNWIKWNSKEGKEHLRQRLFFIAIAMIIFGLIFLVSGIFY